MNGTEQLPFLVETITENDRCRDAPRFVISMIRMRPSTSRPGQGIGRTARAGQAHPGHHESWPAPRERRAHRSTGAPEEHRRRATRWGRSCWVSAAAAGAQGCGGEALQNGGTLWCVLRDEEAGRSWFNCRARDCGRQNQCSHDGQAIAGMLWPEPHPEVPGKQGLQLALFLPGEVLKTQ
jgi:hypothetical protein